MTHKSAILAAMLIPALAGDLVMAADTPRKEPSLPAIYSYRATDIAALRQGFAAPPREAGPWVFWIFFENVMSKAEITRELEEMTAAGIAGAELRFLSMHAFSGKPGPGFDPEGWARLGQKRLEFLSPKFVDALEHACAEARLVVIGDVRTRDEARQILELVEGGTVLVCCRTMPDDWSAFREPTRRRNREISVPEAAENTRIRTNSATNKATSSAALRKPGEAGSLRSAFRAAMERGKVVDARTHGWQKALADAQSIRWLPVSANLSFQHGRVPGGEIHLLTNWGPTFSGEVSFPHADLVPKKGSGPFSRNGPEGASQKRDLTPFSVPEIWNADTGSCLPAGQYRVEQGRTAVALADRGECELLASIVNRADLSKASAAAVDAINTYYGRPNIPIGTDKVGPTALQRTSLYTRGLPDGNQSPDGRLAEQLNLW